MEPTFEEHVSYELTEIRAQVEMIGERVIEIKEANECKDVLETIANTLSDILATLAEK